MSEKEDFDKRVAIADEKLKKLQRDSKLLLVAVLADRGDGIIQPSCRWFDAKPKEQV